MYVSPLIARGLLAADANFAGNEKDARAQFADNEKDARAALRAQFPKPRDITTDEFVAALQDTLAPDGEMPCTVIILDEVQQYIGDDTGRSYVVQEVVEACSKRFGEAGARSALEALAARFSHGMLPQTFRPDHPGFEVQLAREYRLKLEGLVEGLTAEVFKATHTPPYADAPLARGNPALSPEDWLLGDMAAGVDCVAVTHHDSGACTDGCRVEERGALQEEAVREEVCGVTEGGREAFSRRWARLGREV